MKFGVPHPGSQSGPDGRAKKVGLPEPAKIHPAAHIKTQVRFPDSGPVGAAPAIQTPVGRI